MKYKKEDFPFLFEEPQKEILVNHISMYYKLLQLANLNSKERVDSFNSDEEILDMLKGKTKEQFAKARIGKVSLAKISEWVLKKIE